MIALLDDPGFDADAFAALWLAAWGGDPGKYLERVLPRSLCWVGAFDGSRPVGFVNVAWDGGAHAFLLDTLVHPDYRRQGIASRVVRRAAELAMIRGAEWLHVDYEPHLASFYAGCGFRPTQAGLIRLTKQPS